MAEEKVVYSRSKTLFAGTKALGDALELFMPSSKEFMNSETELWDFLCSLKHEGFSPMILTSKDVYGYSSCRAVVPEKCELIPSRRHRTQRAVVRAVIRQQLQLQQEKRTNSQGVSALNSQKSSKRMRAEVSPALPPPPTNFWSSKSSTELRKVATHRLVKNTTITVGNVSSARGLARARRRAERLLRVNLQPTIQLSRLHTTEKGVARLCHSWE